MLREAGWNPSFLIGGDLNEVGTNAAFGDGHGWSSKPTRATARSCRSRPSAAIVTNVEPDHLDHYGGSPSSSTHSNASSTQCPGPSCAESTTMSAPSSPRPAAPPHVRRTSRCRLPASSTTAAPRSVPLHARRARRPARRARRPDRREGRDQRDRRGGDGARARRRVRRSRPCAARFGGVARRFQYRGERDGVAFVDDYAHLPTEVAAAIATAGESFTGRVIVVFQPHRYTRTASLGPSSPTRSPAPTRSFITDVYAAGEEPITGSAVASSPRR